MNILFDYIYDNRIFIMTHIFILNYKNIMNYIFLSIIIIIIIVILLLFYTCYLDNYNDDKIENFDARIPNISKEQCGNFCTRIIGCGGFAYSDNGVCYLSKQAILGKSVNSLFSDDYNVNDYRCNKTQPITSNTDIISPNLRRRNALYVCSDSEQGEYTLQLIAPTARQPIADFDDIDKIDVPDYEFTNDFVWPTDKTDIVFNNLSRNPNQYVMYEKSRDEFLGQYSYPQKCVSDVSELACLKICESDEKCIGVEWNPSYLKYKANKESNLTPNNEGMYQSYKNICCPKTQITEIIPRRPEFINGNFYTKKHIDKLDHNRIYILPI